jgi:sorbose reductase
VGLGLARAVAQAGASIAIIYRSSTDAPQVAESLAKEFGVKAKVRGDPRFAVVTE